MKPKKATHYYLIGGQKIYCCPGHGINIDEYMKGIGINWDLVECETNESCLGCERGIKIM